MRAAIKRLNLSIYFIKLNNNTWFGECCAAGLWCCCTIGNVVNIHSPCLILWRIRLHVIVDLARNL